MKVLSGFRIFGKILPADDQDGYGNNLINGLLARLEHGNLGLEKINENPL